MTNSITRFERRILRPLFVLLLGAAVFLAFHRLWLWMGASLLGLLYLGSIGSKLHPLQSAKDLAAGPLLGEAADSERVLLPEDTKQMLVGHACTRVGLLLGFIAGSLLIGAAEFNWYAAIPIALVATLVFGAILKVGFGTNHSTPKPGAV